MPQLPVPELSSSGMAEFRPACLVRWGARDMLGSDMLEMGIGVSLFFLLVSLLCSAVRERIETAMKTRARDLDRGLRSLLDDPQGTTIVQALLHHGHLSSLFTGDYDPNRLKKTLF